MKNLIDTHWDIEKLKKERVLKEFDLNTIDFYIDWIDATKDKGSEIIISTPEFDKEEFHFYLPCDVTELEDWVICKRNDYKHLIQVDDFGTVYVELEDLMNQDLMKDYCRFKVKDWIFRRD